MKKLKIIVVWLVFVLVGIQLVPPAHNNQIVNSESDLFVMTSAPDTLISLFRTSCYDCHSNKTNYPWYSKIQPIRFIMDNHVKKGVKELNFNDFGGYSNRRQKSKLKSIESQIRTLEMPPNYYTISHKSARLSKQQRELMVNWVNKIEDSINNTN